MTEQTNAEQSLTDGEIRALGIDPQSPFSTCPRMKDAPLDVRFGDDRIVRRIDGGVVVHFGYYSESQQLARRVSSGLFGKMVYERLQAMRQATDELLPCPFCGGPVKLESAGGRYSQIEGSREFWGVVCRNTTNLGGSCGMEQVPSASKEAAIGRWNMRNGVKPEREPRDTRNADTNEVAP